MNAEEVAMICKALGDANRLEIVLMVKNVVARYWRSLK